ncbi:MAG TPA: GtrA family protein [Rhodanobacteraceae bacterium]|nr:GtrA family protein [Rhodanobacteraceae bacterium]
MRLRREIALFALGGVLGFVVDASVVQALVSAFDANPYLARVPSFLAAASVTWWWNRRHTFAHRRQHRALDEWLRWLAVMLLGAAINYGSYAVLVHGLAIVRAWPWLGVAAGSLLAASVNFLGASKLVFTGTPAAK